MKRLFISLYLLLSLSFLGIGWTLDSIWQNNVDDSGVQDAPLIALAQLIGNLPESQREAFLAELSTQQSYPLRLLPKAQVAVNLDDSLARDSVLVTAPDEQHELHFIQVDDQQILMAGPIEIDPREIGRAHV